MASVLSACIVLYHCGDELTHALRCIQNADLEVDVFLADNTPDDLTAEKMQWLFPGIRVLPQSGNIGFGRANNAVIPYLKSKYHLIMNPDVTFDPALLGQNGPVHGRASEHRGADAPGHERGRNRAVPAEEADHGSLPPQRPTGKVRRHLPPLA